MEELKAKYTLVPLQWKMTPLKWQNVTPLHLTPLLTTTIIMMTDNNEKKLLCDSSSKVLLLTATHPVAIQKGTKTQNTQKKVLFLSNRFSV